MYGFYVRRAFTVHGLKQFQKRSKQESKTKTLKKKIKQIPSLSKTVKKQSNRGI